MGAGIAAILTYILRENEKFSSCTCIAFGPGMSPLNTLCLHLILIHVLDILLHNHLLLLTLYLHVQTSSLGT